MKSPDQTWEVAVAASTATVGTTPPADIVPRLAKLLDRITSGNHSPSWAASMLWEGWEPSHVLCIEWHYQGGLSIGVEIQKGADGFAHVVRGGVGVAVELDLPESVDLTNPVFSILTAVQATVSYGPQQLIQWIGHCLPGPSWEHAREAQEPPSRVPDPLPDFVGFRLADGRVITADQINGAFHA